MTTARHCKDCPEPKVLSCTTCCKVCKDCPHCFDLSLEKVRLYLAAIDRSLVELSESALCLDLWGYGCQPFSEDDYESLLIFRQYLKKYYDASRLNYDSGMCPDEVQKVLEATSKRVSLTFHSSENLSGVDVDDTPFEPWVLENPFCVAYEDWERCMIRLVPKVGIKVQSKEICRILYDAKATSHVEDYKFIYTLSVAAHAIGRSLTPKGVGGLLNCGLDYKAVVTSVSQCDLGYDIKSNLIDKCNLSADVKVTLSECLLNYKALVTSTKCDLDFSTYVKLLECNLSHQVISNFVECGVTPTYEAKSVYIQTENCKIGLADVSLEELDDSSFIQTLVDSYEEP